MKRRFGWFSLAVALLVPLLCSELKAQSVLTAHTRTVVTNGLAKPLGRLAVTEQLQLDLVLPLRDEQGLEVLLAGLYDPNSPNYRQFLTVEQFTERFGPTQEDYDAVVQFARANGLKVVGGSRHGMDVQVKGSAASVEQAFHVSLRTYQHPTENRVFYAADTEPVANLNVQLWHVTGLDNYAQPTPRLSRRPESAAATSSSATGNKSQLGATTALWATPNANAGSGPSASYLGSDMRAAYYGSGTLTGAGQHLALIEYWGANLADLTTYLKNAGQTNTVPVTLISTDGTSTACNYTAAGNYCDDTEPILDITQAIGMAPGLAGLEVYVGSSDTAILSAMTTHTPLANTIGCSWGWGADPTILDPYFKKMAAQGQSFLAASGDSATWSATNTAWPADDAYVTSVGGTDLVTTGAGGAWKSETAWANSGGGISSTKIAIPAWQQLAGVVTTANKGSLVYRNGPDVAANADYTFYVCSKQQACTANAYGGTSFAAPMWAAYLALVNQQLAAKGSGPVGFINPTIYAAALTSNYSTYFHDITSGTAGSYSAGTGFDLVTGWGSPNGSGLINLLTGTAASASFTLTASPTTVSVVQGKTGSSTITSAVVGGFSSAVSLTASGQPNGVTVSFSSASIASPGSGTSTMTVAVASTVAAGSYTLTVTGAGSNVTKTSTVTLTVTAAPSFTLAATPAALSVAQGKSGTATVTTAAVAGFSSAVSLTASGAPTGVTLALSAASIATPGSSTLTATVASTVATGTYPITITATGGGVTQTATVQLTVTPPPTFTLAASAATLSVMQGKSGSVTLTTTAQNSFASAVAFTVSGHPTGVTVSLSPASVTGSGTSTMTVVAATTAVAGNYTLTVTGTGGGVTKTTTVALTITPMPTFTLTASPTTLSVMQGNKGTATLTTTAANGFTSTIAYTATGAPTGVTIAIGTGTAATVGAAALTATVAATATPGTYPITITATGGGVTQTAALSLTVTAAPTFTLAAAPVAISVVQKSKNTTTVSTTAVSGYSTAVTLAASGQPAGMTVSFSAASVATPGSAVMTVAATDAVATGTYNLTVTGVSGSITKTSTVAVTVTPAPSFTLTASPTSLSVPQTKSGAVTLTTAALYGFNSAVTYTASGMPAGVTASFSAASSATPGSTVLTLAAASTTVTGSYAVTVTATGGGVTKTASVTLTVTPPPTFTLTPSSTALAVAEGKTSTATVTTAALYGFNSAAALTASGMPAGVTVSFSAASVATPGTATMTVAAATTAATGVYPITISATGGGVTKTATIALTVTPPPTFTLTASPAALSVVQGQSGAVALATSALYGFNSAVTYTAAGQPTGVTVSFGATSSAITSTAMTVAVASTVAPGSYPITVTGTGGGVTKTATVTLTVTGAPSFTLAAGTSALSVMQGKSGTVGLSTAVVYGFSSAVGLTASGLPAGVTVGFSPASIAGAGSSTLTVTAAATATPGTYTLTVTGTSGSLVKTVPVVLTVTGAPTFTLVAAPAAFSVVQGKAGTATVTPSPLYGFNTALSYTVTGLPAGASASFAATAGSTATTGAALTVNVPSTVATGTYSLTITGSGGGVTKTATVALTVTAPPSFTLGQSASSLTVVQGKSAAVTFTTAALSGFSSPVGLTITGVPTGVSGSFNPATISAAGTTTLTLAAAASTTAGSYPLTITATGGGITKTANVILTVALPPSFSLAATPSAVSVAQGKTITSSVSSAPLNGFNSAIALAAAGMPTGMSVTFSSASIAAGGASTVNVVAASTLATGTYLVTVTGTGGGVTKTATLAVTVQPAPSFMLTASPTTLTIARGASGSSVLTASYTSGFSSAITLSLVGQAGIMPSFTAGGASAGASTLGLTFYVASNLAPGTYTETINASGGGVTRSVSIVITVK